MKGTAYDIPVRLGMNVDVDPKSMNPLTLAHNNQIQFSFQPQLHQGCPSHLRRHHTPFPILVVVLFVVIIGTPRGSRTVSQPSGTGYLSPRRR